MSGYNFTEGTRKCLSLAREEAARLNHGYINTEHILLGLLAEGDGVGTVVLQNLGVDLRELASDIKRKAQPGTPDVSLGPDLPYASRGKKVLDLAIFEASKMNHSYVGTEHLLLGLIEEDTGVAAQALLDRGVTLDKATAETHRILGDEFQRDSRRSRS